MTRHSRTGLRRTGQLSPSPYRNVSQPPRPPTSCGASPVTPGLTTWQRQRATSCRRYDVTWHDMSVHERIWHDRTWQDMAGQDYAGQDSCHLRRMETPFNPRPPPFRRLNLHNITTSHTVRPRYCRKQYAIPSGRYRSDPRSTSPRNQPSATAGCLDP